MNYLSSRLFLLLPALALNVLIPSNIEAADVRAYSVGKGIVYQQTSASALSLTEQPWSFYSSVEVTNKTGVTGVTLRLPTSNLRNLEAVEATTPNGVDYGFQFFSFHGQKSALDLEYPIGSYGFTINGREGRKTPSLTLGGDAYPATPRIANWSDVQAIESDFPVTITWAPFAGGTTNDYISFQVLDSTGTIIYFSTPSSAEGGPQYLNGKATRVTIPAGTLPADTTFTAGLTFLKMTGRNRTALAGAVGETGYFKITSSPVKTLPAPPLKGRFQFMASSFAVNELRTSATVTITRASSWGVAKVIFTSASGTATAGQDFTSESRELEFADAVTSTNIVIPLRDDVRLEGNETILLSLSSPSTGAILGTRKTAVLNIVDNEIAGAGILQFQQAGVSLWESNAAVRMNVRRTGGSLGTVSARYTTVAGTATSDFVSKTGIVQFGPGETNKTISIRLNDDAIDELNESFSVQLSQLTGGAALGLNKACKVTLVDNDPAVVSGSTTSSSSYSGGLYEFKLNLGRVTRESFYTRELLLNPRSDSSGYPSPSND